MKFKLFIIATLVVTFGLVSSVSAETATTSANADVMVKPIAVTTAVVPAVNLAFSSIFTSLLGRFNYLSI